MLKVIKMPELGTAVDEITVLRWLKKEGDPVDRGELLLEVETDKSTIEVESYAAGYVLKILVPEGETVASGDEIAWIGNTDDAPGITPAPGPTEERPAQTGEGAMQRPRPEVNVSPMVRKLAEKLGVDLSAVEGGSPKGLILKEDVLKAAQGGPPPSPAEPFANGQSGKAPAVIPFTRVERAVAGAMSRSMSTIPHIDFTCSVDASAMMRARLASGKTISYNAMLVLAVVKCLKPYPYLASAYSDEGRVPAGEINIGVAVAKGNDLFVPVVKGIDPASTSLEYIEQELQRLVRAVQMGQVKQNDLSGGCFTISNLGSHGIDSFTAIINPPEAGILAVGSIRDRVVAVDGAAAIRPVMNLTLSADHRIVNGAYAVDFMQELTKQLEEV